MTSPGTPEPGRRLTVDGSYADSHDLGFADDLADARAVVAKVQADMRAEDEAGGKALLRTLDSMHPEARIRFMAHTVSLEREQAAALDYAETRLAELQERVESLAQELDGGPACDSDVDACNWDVANRLREALRG